MFPDYLGRYPPSRSALARLTPEELECYHARAKALKPRAPWTGELEKVWEACLVHKSNHVPGKVEYFATVENMLANKTTRTSPEMFLSRYLAAATAEIRTEWSIQALEQALPEILFIPNTDPEGWEKVYRNGPHSCMRFSKEVRQYAHPNNDLALAYVEKDDDIISRTIVDQAKKQYLRIYADTDFDAVLMANALNKLGYKRSNDTLIGNIIHIKSAECVNCCREVWVGPYFDGSAHTVEFPIKDGQQVFNEGVISEDGEYLVNTAEERDVVCSDECHPDDYDDDDDDYDEED